VYKLTGKKSQRQEVEEISFEDSYYLSGIRGYASSEGIHSLSFIFSKDFSSHLKKDLSSKIEAALQVLRQEPSCQLTDAEKEKIQQMFMGQVFVELDEATLDPYAVLGLKESASLEEVKKAYHKLARIYHPDKAESYKVGLYRRKFLEISTAYQALEGKLGGTSAKPNQHSSPPWALS
jgi:DnaJ-domain-containing protein 1